MDGRMDKEGRKGRNRIGKGNNQKKEERREKTREMASLAMKKGKAWGPTTEWDSPSPLLKKSTPKVQRTGDSSQGCW